MPAEEIPAVLDFAPVGISRKVAENVSAATTGLENTTARLEMRDEMLCQIERSLNIVVGIVVAVGLEAHPDLQPCLAGVVQTKKEARFVSRQTGP